MPPTYDVIVVGSGPAGSCAAWQLAQAGVEVAVLEKAALPRYKTCGGGLVGRARRWLPIDVRHVIEQECCGAQLNFLLSNLSFTTYRPTPLVSMTMRSELDFALLSAAQTSGAVVHRLCTVERMSLHDDSATVLTTRGPMRSRFVIAADGALSPVTRSMGWEDGRLLIPALEWEVTVPLSRLRSFEGVARFDFDIVPTGYAWIFPKRHHLSIGVLSMRRQRHGLHAAMARYLDLLGFSTPEQVEQHGFVIPVRPRRGGVARERILLVGDAAGFADPVTGEGISYAVKSGLLAAQSLIDGHLEREAVESIYDRLIARALLPELRIGSMLARFLYDYPRIRTWAFLKQGQVLCEAMADVMTGTRRYRDLVRLGPLFRFFRSRGLSCLMGRSPQVGQR
ncbi:MAG: geranylgeranyl reductase family protein [Nitrospira sp.]|nr:geranylgeranyl reductase family protein [Nitrospira sp.]